MSPSIDLRPFSESDFEPLLEWIDSSTALLQWAGPTFSYPLDRAQLRERLPEMTGTNPTQRAYKAVNKDDQMVGYIELNGIEHNNRSGTISRLLVDPDHRGQGIGTAIIQRVLEIGFEELNLHRIDLKVFEFNDTAIACYERVGFTHEECLRDDRRDGDDYWSIIQTRILKDEWATGRSGRAL